MYEWVRIALSFCLELIFLRTLARIIPMRSNKVFYILGVVRFATYNTLIYLGLATVYVSIALIMIQLLFPVLCAKERSLNSLFRSVLTIGIVASTDFLGSALWLYLTGGAIPLNPVTAENVVPVTIVYCVLLLVAAVLFELLTAFLSHLDGADTAMFELLAIPYLTASTLLFWILQERMYGHDFATPNATFVVTATSILGAGIVMVIIATAQRDAQVMRLLGQQQAAARLSKHLGAQIANQAVYSSATRRLRHDLANQVDVVRELAAAGRTQEADRYLAALQEQARNLGTSRR